MQERIKRTKLKIGEKEGLFRVAKSKDTNSLKKGHHMIGRVETKTLGVLAPGEGHKPS